MNHHEIQADLQKKGIRKRILHAGADELPNYVSGGKVGPDGLFVVVWTETDPFHCTCIH